MVVGEVCDGGGAYNCTYNNTAWLSYTCDDNFPLVVTYERKDNKNDTGCIPNTKIISEAITRHESPIELQKKKVYFEQSWIKRDKSFHWEKDTPRRLIRERKRWLWTKKERAKGAVMIEKTKNKSMTKSTLDKMFSSAFGVASPITEAEQMNWIH